MTRVDRAALAERAERAERVRGPLLTIAGLSVATLALRLRDPHQSGSWGFCPLQAATGIYCPGCGGLRAVNDLTHGEVGAALSSNLLVTLAVPVATVLLALWLVRTWQGRQEPVGSTSLTRPMWAALAVVVLVFTVLRNTPAGSWLAP